MDYEKFLVQKLHKDRTFLKFEILFIVYNSLHHYHSLIQQTSKFTSTQKNQKILRIICTYNLWSILRNYFANIFSIMWIWYLSRSSNNSYTLICHNQQFILIERKYIEDMFLLVHTHLFWFFISKEYFMIIPLNQDIFSFFYIDVSMPNAIHLFRILTC